MVLARLGDPIANRLVVPFLACSLALWFRIMKTKPLRPIYTPRRSAFPFVINSLNSVEGIRTQNHATL